jgi:hypothetical protein
MHDQDGRRQSQAPNFCGAVIADARALAAGCHRRVTNSWPRRPKLRSPKVTSEIERQPVPNTMRERGETLSRRHEAAPALAPGRWLWINGALIRSVAGVNAPADARPGEPQLGINPSRAAA